MANKNSKKSERLFLSIFIFLTLSLCVGGYVLFRYQEKNISIQKHDELAAIGKLKVDQIVYWREERMGDARSIYNDQAIITHIREYIQGVDHNANYRRIKLWMKSILDEPDYSQVILCDPTGKILINTHPSLPVNESGKGILEKAQQSKNIVFSDVFRYNEKSNYIDMAIPLYLDSENHEGFSGVVMLRINPDKNLYPLILSWPTPSRTSEILLVCRKGDSAIFLSVLDHRKNIVSRFPALRTGVHVIPFRNWVEKASIFESIDYRGIHVLGDTCPVPGSSWFIVAKVDIDEIYHPIYIFSLWIFTITILLILISALVLYLVWKQQLVKSERERKALQQHFDYVIKYANDIICLANERGDIYEVNDKAVRTYGYSYEELLKLNIEQFRPPETNETFEQHLTWLKESGGSIFETVNIKKNGEMFPVEVSGIIMDIMGIQYIQLIIRDITDRNLALEKLRASEKGFRTLAESMPQFVWVAQADGGVSYVNRRWTEFTGLTGEESFGWGWIVPFHPEDKQRVLDAWKHSTDTGESYNIECRLKKLDQDYLWFIIKGEPIRDSAGAIIKWYGTCTEIDSQKQIEKEIKMLNDELEAFSYSVSHDLRAPLHNIDGLSAALLERSYNQLDEKGRQFLTHVRNETLRMKDLIEALYNLSHVNRIELKKGDVDLSTLAHDISHRLLNESSNRQVEITIQPGMVAFGDSHLLEIVLTNLLDNAFKYSGKQPLARIEFGKSIINHQPTFWVRDNGAGFDMADSKKLFGAFQRLHPKSDFPGTGIGLATVQRIIRRHEGHIWAESLINQGTTFYFTLPEDDA